MTWNVYSNVFSLSGTSIRRDSANSTVYTWPEVSRADGLNSTVFKSSQTVVPVTLGLKSKSFTLVSPRDVESTTSWDRAIRTVEPELTTPPVYEVTYSPKAGSIPAEGPSSLRAFLKYRTAVISTINTAPMPSFVHGRFFIVVQEFWKGK